MILPAELIDEIVYFCDIKTTIVISKIFPIIHNNLKSLLSVKIGFDVNDYKLEDIETISTLKFQISLLNWTGIHYNIWCGFSDSDFYTIINKHADIFVGDLKDMIVPFHIINIKRRADCWNQIPTNEWYNKPPRLPTGEEYIKYLLPFVNSKSYITVNDPFMQVNLSAEKKGMLLTIDDILFATRTLIEDDKKHATNKYYSYSILSAEKGVLTLLFQ